MIPRLRAATGPLPLMEGFARTLVDEGFAGEVEINASTRTVYATDNSIYQVEPAAVVFPKGVDDLKALTRVMSEPHFASMALTPRGGGTGTNGQSLTCGVVADCSRHMTRILHIDPVRRVARVEAGVVKDQLNLALKPYGLFFAPELSTSNRATLGGMISTDACGQGSCLYGKTSNHVLGLRIVLIDGTDWWSCPVDDATLGDLMARTDRIGAIHRVVDTIARTEQDRIKAVFPNLNRYMTGYDLAHIRRSDGQFDLNAILCGSEGTLAMIAEAELNLVPIPAHAALINIRYADFNTALEDARSLAALNVASVETVDERVLSLAKNDIIWTGIAKYFPNDTGKTANAINIAEVIGDTQDEVEAQLARVTKALDTGTQGRHSGHTIARGHADVEAIWAMRKRAVGLLGSVDGPVRPVAFVEDTAVPPENLAAYIREFRALLDGAGIAYGMFGHVDAGVLHVRPALDLTRDDHKAAVRSITDAVVGLTRRYGGVLWGEHGKGVRSEYVPEFFGELYPCLQDIKAAFDPENRLNPGKIATPKTEALLKIDEVPLRGLTDRVIGNDIRAAFDNAAYCNGNGACFDFDLTSPMCPSFKATGDRRYSPKGRASLMREWLKLLAEKGIDPQREAERLRRAPRILQWPVRAFQSLDPRNRKDFSHEVRAAMDTCLACKACAGQCPVKVSVPAFRSKFLEVYHGRYLRPLKDPLVAAIESTLPWMAKVRPLYNLMTTSGFGKAALHLAGLTALPQIPPLSLKREAARLGVTVATIERMESLSAHERQNAVIIVADTFTAHFTPQVAIATIELARKMGFSPYLAAPVTNGKALHVHGYLGRFNRIAKRTADYFDRLFETGVPLVGIDPSMTLTFRSEYKTLNGRAIQAKVLLPQEWLAANLNRLQPVDQHLTATRYRLMPHCTERTNAPAAMAQWKSVFQHLGVTLQAIDVGCCGMAGTFGHEVRNRPISEKLYDMSWRREIAEGNDELVLLATGYSCRAQVKEMDRQRIDHPVQILNKFAAKTVNRQHRVWNDM